jgi:hypothetical protein
MNKTPLSEQHEHYAQRFMDSVWDVVAQGSSKLAAHEIIGILETIKAKISFDHNVRAANEEVKKMRDENKPSGIVDAGGFPVD